MGRQLQGINLCLQPLCCKKQKTGRGSDRNCIWCVSLEHRAWSHCRAAAHTNLPSQSMVFRPEGRQQEPPALPSAQGRATTGNHSDLVLLWISQHGEVRKEDFFFFFFLRGRKGRKMQAEADLWLYLFYSVRKWSVLLTPQTRVHLTTGGKQTANSGL